MYQLVSIEINFLCVLLLLGVLYFIKRDINQQTESQNFYTMVSSVILILFIGAFRQMLEGRTQMGLHTANLILSAVHLFLTGFVCWLWLYNVVNWRKRGTKKVLGVHRFFWRIPLMILAILCITSLWTGWLFAIDSENHFHRGSLYPVYLTISYFYFVMSAYLILTEMKRLTDHFAKRELQRLLLIYTLPFGCSILGEIFYGLLSTWPAVTLTLIAVFVGFQNYEISTDSLTGLNNRRRFDKYISSASTEIYPSRKLFLLMMDINHFKKINDTFGHLEGDCALMEAAALLRQACMDDDIFLARYGGDEFVAVGMFEDREEAEQYKKKIRNRFDRRNRKEQILYQLVLSIGIAEYHMELSDGLETLIREADQNMYYEKDTQYQQQMRQLRNKQVVG